MNQWSLILHACELPDQRSSYQRRSMEALSTMNEHILSSQQYFQSCLPNVLKIGLSVLSIPNSAQKLACRRISWIYVRGLRPDAIDDERDVPVLVPLPPCTRTNFAHDSQHNVTFELGVGSQAIRWKASARLQLITPHCSKCLL